MDPTWSIGPQETQLPRSDIAAITAGPDGYLWLAGDELLVDTGQVDAARVKSSTDSLISGTAYDGPISSLVSDPEVGMWFASGILGHFDLWTDKVTNIDIKADAIAAAPGGLWVANNEQIQLFNFESQKVEQVVEIENHRINPDASSVVSDKQGNLYVADRDRLTIIDGELDQTHRTLSGTFLSMAPALDKGVWITTSSGLWKLDGPGHLPQWIADCFPSTASSLAPGHPLSELSNDIVAIGVGRSGMALFDTAANKWILNAFGGQDRANGFLEIYEDESGRIWAATEKSGLVRIHPKPTAFNYLPLADIPSTAGVNIADLSFHGHSLWVAARTDGLHRYNVETNEWSRPTNYEDWASSLDDQDRVSPINIATVEAHPHQVLIGGWGRGLFRADSSGLRASEEYPAQSSYVQAVKHLKGGYELVGYWAGELAVFDEARRRRSSIERNGKVTEIGDSQLLHSVRVIEEYNDVVFIAGANGLLVVDLEAQTTREFTKANGGILAASINDIWAQSDSVVWIASSSGVERLDLATETTQALTRRNGMPKLAVNALHPHPSGETLWLGTGDGLFAADITTGSIQASYYSNDGLPSNLFTAGVSATDHNGMVYMSTDRGIAVLPDDPIESNFAQDGARVRCSLGCGDHYDGITIESDGPVAFEFVSNDYDNRGSPAVEYRLIGLDEDWKPLPPGRSVYYPSLQPGSHTFAVRQLHPQPLAGLGDESFNGGHELSRAQINIIVRKPWWLRAWVQMTSVLAALGAVALVLHLRDRSRKAVQQLLEVTILERTKELELSRADAEFANQAKDRFLRAFSHDLRSPLNGVMGYSDLLGATSLTERQRRYADGVRAASEQLSKMVEDIVTSGWDTSIGQPSTVSPTSLKSVLDHVVQYVETAADSRGITLTKQLDIQDPTLLVDERGLRHVIINLLANAIVHSKGQNVGVAVIQQSNDEDGTNTYEFKVWDDGGRLDPDEVPRLLEPGQRGTHTSSSGTGLGLSMCRDWISSHGSSLNVDVLPEVSTVFSFALKGAPPNATADSHLSPAKPVVVIVDDETVARDAINDMLTELNCDVRACTSAHDVLDILFLEQCDLLITDVMMQPTSGIDLARLVQNRLADDPPPIVAATGVPDAAEITGVFDLVLSKPIRINDLRHALALIDSPKQPVPTLEDSLDR